MKADTVEEHDARIAEFRRQGFGEHDARRKAEISMVTEQLVAALRAREVMLDRLVDFIEIGGSSHTDVLNCLHDLLDTEAKAEPEAPWVAKLRDIESKL